MKQSLINLDKSVQFTETFNSESDVESNNGTPTDVSFNNGFASFNGSSSVITYPGIARSLNTITFLVLLNSTTEDIITLSASHSITVSSGTISANGFSSSTIYVNGTQTTTVTSGCWLRITIVTSTSFSSNDIQIGFVSSYLDGSVDNLNIYNRALSSNEVELLYENALYREPVFENEIISIDSRNGGIFDKYDNSITNTDVLEVIESGIYHQSYNGVSSKLEVGNLGEIKSISFWIFYNGTNQSVLTIDGGTNNLTITSDTLSSLGDNRYVNGLDTDALSIGWNLVTIISAAGLNATDFIFGNESTNFFTGKTNIIKISLNELSLKTHTQLYNSTKNYFNK